MDDNNGNNEQVFTDLQNRTLSTIPIFISFFSFNASLLVIVIILLDRSKLLKNTYDRIMLGLSIFDVLFATGMIGFGPWAIPEDVTFVVGARASSPVPCEIGGALIHAYLGSILYTAALMVYFVLLVKLEWRPERIAKHVEPCLHVFCIIVPIGTGAYAIAKDFMNPHPQLPGLCWIAPFPPDCEFNSEVECTRGKGSYNYARGVGGGVSFMTILIIIGAMYSLYVKVRSTEKKLRRYQPRGSMVGSLERTRRTAIRGLMYIAAFFVSFIPAGIFQFVSVEFDREHRAAQFFIGTVTVFLVPLPGFLNAVIYLYPRRREFNERGRGLYRLSHWVLQLCSCWKNGHGAARSSGTALPTGTTEQLQQYTINKGNNVTSKQEEGNHTPPVIQETGRQHQKEETSSPAKPAAVPSVLAAGDTKSGAATGAEITNQIADDPRKHDSGEKDAPEVWQNEHMEEKPFVMETSAAFETRRKNDLSPLDEVEIAPSTEGTATAQIPNNIRAVDANASSVVHNKTEKDERLDNVVGAPAEGDEARSNRSENARTGPMSNSLPNHEEVQA